MKWLNYHHLYYFKVIASEGGIAKASRKLRLGQPTLSSQLKQLEETLGATLFERKNRTMALTDSGRVVLEYAKEIFRLGDEMLEAMNDNLSSNRVHLHIGTLDSVPKHLTLKLVEAAYGVGKCIVSISEGRGDELMRELAAHRLDLVLSNYPAPAGDRGKLFSRSVGRMPVTVVAHPKYAALKNGFPSSLQGQPLILPSVHSKLRFDMEHWLELNQIHAEMVAESQDTILQKLLATHGVGLAPIARPAATELLSSGTLIEIGTLDNVTEELWLVSSQRRIQNPVATQLMKSFSLSDQTLKG